MNKISKPLVSVNIRTYNSEATLEKTLKSVKEQIYPNIEVIISDGFSKDKSVAIAKKYQAKVFYAAKLGDARNQAHKHSQGKYILSVDSDQVLDQTLIEACVKTAEKGKYDALIISELSLIEEGTLLEKIIAYDKWLIDKAQDDDALFGAACPRFFLKETIMKINWAKGLSIFDDTILYAELLKNGARVKYLKKPAIRHHEVKSWRVLFTKFYRYGQGYLKAFRENPGTIAAHSLPRKAYFSRQALTKPSYFFGLLVLHAVKTVAAGLGVLSSTEVRNLLVYLGDYLYYWKLEKELQDCRTVLDLGCGVNSPLQKITKNFKSTGVDIFKKSLEASKKQGIHDHYVLADVTKIETVFKAGSFDAVVALDLIEHLPKSAGYQLLAKMEKIARKKVIVLTPHGFFKQRPYGGNPYQVHQSGWYREDFSKRGYNVWGMRGLRILRGEEATLKFKPWFFWGLVSTASQLVTYFFPALAYQFLAVKYLNK